MDIRKVKKLIELLEESGIAEIEIKEGEEAVRISRMPTGPMVAHMAPAMMQAPVALLGALVTAPGGITTVLKIARVLGRNYSLVLLLVMIGALFYPSADEGQGEGRRRDDLHPPSPLH